MMIVTIVTKGETSGYLMAVLFRQYFTRSSKGYEKYNYEGVKVVLEKFK